jgi:hypothetical protein
MTTEPRKPHDPWARSVLNAARRWLVLPLALGAVGAVAGGWVGSVAKPSAEALLVVGSEAVDGQGMDRTVESEVLQLNTQTVFDAAARPAGADADDLRARTKIGARPNTLIISIKVTAGSSAQAVRESSAVANAAVQAAAVQLPAQLHAITDETDRLIKEQKLDSKSAETARLARLGDAAAGRLSDVLAGAQRLRLLQAGEPTRLVPAPGILAAMGGLVGALLGLALAQLFGARRGTLRSGKELTRLYPDAAVILPSELDNMITIEPKAKTVFVAGVRRSGEDLRVVTEIVRRSLASLGHEVLVRNGAPSPDQPTNGHIDLIPTMLSDTVLRRTARDDKAVLIVPVQPKVTRLEALAAYLPRLSDRTYLLLDEHSSAEWN